MKRKPEMMIAAFNLLWIACVIHCISIPAVSLRADEGLDTKRDRAWIEQRVQDWQPTKAERAFDQIGWAPDLLQAEELAKKHGRLIFLFTYDGANMACYRC